MSASMLRSGEGVIDRFAIHVNPTKAQNNNNIDDEEQGRRNGTDKNTEKQKTLAAGFILLT